MIRLRPATSDDAAAIASIYAPFVSDSAISFETDPPDAAEIAARIRAADASYPWLVASEEGRILGYAYASRFRAREAYRFSVETSVYVLPAAQRRGLATRLYRELIDTLVAQGFTQAMAAIGLPNQASVLFHEAFGFENTGIYRKAGYKLGRWHDVGLWQRPLAGTEVPPREPRKLSELGSIHPR
ncbi:MAG: family N-acetyltransferase [Alphaproteobacteria bacterium]|nr:family N-acetyltransferase [Alphaproteobacteria bacterium]